MGIMGCEEGEEYKWKYYLRDAQRCVWLRR